NEGTHDVSVIDVGKAIAGAPDWETFRIPVERGPWAIASSPDGGLVALTNRDDDETDEAGHFISLIDVEKAIAKAQDAEIRRVLRRRAQHQGRRHAVADRPPGPENGRHGHRRRQRALFAGDRDRAMNAFAADRSVLENRSQTPNNSDREAPFGGLCPRDQIQSIFWSIAD